MMKYPCLVLKNLCQTDIRIVVESDDIGEDGAPLGSYSWIGKCNYQDKATRIYNGDKTYINVSGQCFVPGDIFPDLPAISSGMVRIFGETRTLKLGIKARNPDGTVNYTMIGIE